MLVTTVCVVKVLVCAGRVVDEVTCVMPLATVTGGGVMMLVVVVNTLKVSVVVGAVKVLNTEAV